MTSIEVFISYHQKDEDLREELEKHLTSLQREKTIISWSDRKIVAGQEFKGEINKYLNQAGLILLLVSPDFIASEYHWTVEVTRALEQNAAGKASVIPVLLRSVYWETPPIDELSPLPSNRKPITSWNDRDEAFVDVVKGIREEVKRLVANSNYSPPQQTSQELQERQYQVTSLINEADRLREDKNFEKAVLKYKAALSLDPNSVLAHTNLGFALFVQGKLDQAIACYQKALQIDPNYAGAHNSLGAPLFAQGKLDQAITFFQKVLQIDLNYTKLPKIELFGIKLPIGLAFEQIIPSKTTSFYADVHTNLGLALSAQGKPDQAIASYRKALQIDPNHANAHNNLGNALSAQGKLEDAIASYRKALQIDPNFAGAHCALGFALSNQGKLDEAIAELEIAVHLEPTNALFRKNLEIIRNNKKGFWGRLFGG